MAATMPLCCTSNADMCTLCIGDTNSMRSVSNAAGASSCEFYTECIHYLPAHTHRIVLAQHFGHLQQFRHRIAVLCRTREVLIQQCLRCGLDPFAHVQTIRRGHTLGVLGALNT